MKKYISLISIKKISKSKKSKKKYEAKFIVNGKVKIVRFGSAGMSDYTQHKDAARMILYRLRHSKVGNKNDPLSPAALSWYVSWSSKTLAGGIANYKKRFGF
mgnify:CR=1 FL=1